MASGPDPLPATEVLQHFAVAPAQYLGGRVNQHWLVDSGASRLVLRGYSRQEAFDDIGYELEVMRRIHALGWPAPQLAADPLTFNSRTWCLFTWLPGAPPEPGAVEQRSRGRLLAQLHESLSTLTGMGQRRSFSLSDELVGDPELTDQVRAYERLLPREGHILRWHLEQARERFAALDLTAAPQIVLHSDFTPWNLLFEVGELTGILDFEATHLNYRVADFALAWRGDQDEVLAGYEEVSQLSDLERELIVPAYWSWLFAGVKDAIRAMTAGQVPQHSFEWQIEHLLRRSGIFGQRAPRYPGP
jgi:Ser/Thr protein kinase RdoA (MazF antagonist)